MLMYEVSTKKYTISFDDGKYYVQETKGFDSKLFFATDYEVIYTGAEFADALLWLNNHLASKDL